MWIIYQADNSHEMSWLVFSQKYLKKNEEKKKKKKIECRLLQILLHALRVIICTPKFKCYLMVKWKQFLVNSSTYSFLWQYMSGFKDKNLKAPMLLHDKIGEAFVKTKF